MEDVYKEIYDKLAKLPPPPHVTLKSQLHSVLRTIIDAEYYRKNLAQEARKQYKQINKIKKDTINTIRRLIELLNHQWQKTEKSNIYSGVETNLLYLVMISVLKKSGFTIPDKESYFSGGVIEPETQRILDRFRILEYYPIQELLEALVRECEENELSVLYSGMEEVLRFQRPSPTDFIRFFLARLESLKGVILPIEFDLSAESVLAIAKCATGLFSENSDESLISHAKNRTSPIKIPVTKALFIPDYPH